MNRTLKKSVGLFLPVAISVSLFALSGCYREGKSSSGYSERQAERDQEEQRLQDIVNARVAYDDEFKSRWDLNDIQMFMTQSQIRNQFGDPDAIDIGTETETWYYGAWGRFDVNSRLIHKESISDYSEKLKRDIASAGYPLGGNRIVFLRPKGEQNLALVTGWKFHLHNGVSPGLPDEERHEIPSTFTLSNVRDAQPGMNMLQILAKFGNPDLLYYRSSAEYSGHIKLPLDNWVMTYWVSRSPSFKSNDFWFSPDGKLVGWDVRHFSDAK